MVEVLFTITRLVMVEVALLTRMGTEVVGERAPLKSSHDWPKPVVGQAVRQISPVKQMVVEVKLVEVAFVVRRMEEKRVVEVAFVVLPLRAEKSWNVEEAETKRLVVVEVVKRAFVAMSEEAKNAVEVPLVAFRFKVSSQPVVVALVVVRLPETSAFPCTEKVVPGVEVPTPVLPVLMMVKSEVVAKAAVDEETLKSVVGGMACPAVVVELACMEKNA